MNLKRQLPLCEENQIPFIPFFSLQTSLPIGQDKMKKLADIKGVTIAELDIARLLHQPAWKLPISGTTPIKHLEENINAVDIALSGNELAFLT